MVKRKERPKREENVDTRLSDAEELSTVEIAAQNSTSVEGGLISITPDGILGWAWDPANPDYLPRVTIETGSGMTLGTAIADIFDHAVIRGRVGPGIPGFVMKLLVTSEESLPMTLILKDQGGRNLGTPLVLNDPAVLEPMLSNMGRSVYEGHIDGLHHGFLSGWAWSPLSPDLPVVVELYDADERIDRTVASLYRDDLAAADKRGGHCAFQFDLPISLLDGHVHSLKVRIADSQFELPGAPMVFGPLSDTAVLQELVSLRAEVKRLEQAVSRVVSPKGDIQSALVRILSERIAALAEVQRETVERELDALRAFAFRSSTAPIQATGPEAGSLTKADNQRSRPQQHKPGKGNGRLRKQQTKRS